MPPDQKIQASLDWASDSAPFIFHTNIYFVSLVAPGRDGGTRHNMMSKAKLEESSWSKWSGIF